MENKTLNKLEVKGPGLLKALQEAHSNKKNINIVYDYDILGLPLRAGYFFTDKKRRKPRLNQKLRGFLRMKLK